MFVISRKCEAEIYIGPDIIIKVLEIRKGQIKLGIDAPSGLSIWRGELLPITDRGERPVKRNNSCRSQ
jgi:carbon storage regulator